MLDSKHSKYSKYVNMAEESKYCSDGMKKILAKNL